MRQLLRSGVDGLPAAVALGQVGPRHPDVVPHVKVPDGVGAKLGVVLGVQTQMTDCPSAKLISCHRQKSHNLFRILYPSLRVDVLCVCSLGGELAAVAREELVDGEAGVGVVRRDEVGHGAARKTEGPAHWKQTISR